jgi:hypothetical protein
VTYARTRRVSVAATGVLCALLGVVGASAVAATEAAGQQPACDLTVTDVKPADGLQEKWREFGDRAGAGEWAGGDGTYSAPLPDGRVAWLFNDTFLGPVGEGGSIIPHPPVHNTIVTAHGESDRPLETIIDGTAETPLPLVGPPGTAEPWYWNGDGIVDDGKLRVFEYKQQTAGEGHFGFEWIATDLATFSLPELELESVQPTYGANNVQWGVELLRVGGYIYIYGMETAFLDKHVHIARAPVGNLDADWEFYTGTGWSPDEDDSARILRAVGASYGVTRVRDRYVLATTDQFLGSEVYLHVASTPVGFAGSERVTIYDTPEGQPEYDEDAAGDIYTYNIAAHPHLGGENTLVLSYNVNSTQIADLNRDINNNRARFIEVRFAPERRPCEAPNAD